jgi:hypothetical protein
MAEPMPDLATILGADLVGGDARMSQRIARQRINKLTLAA